MSKNPSNGLWSQLKKRKIVRVALVYIFVSWIIIQLGEASLEALQVPMWGMSLLLVLVALGFPLALVLAWGYELGPRSKRGDGPGHIESHTDFEGIDDKAPSIAVLPFDDLSENHDQGYFCEGMAEEILNALCKVANLRVASRVAAFQLDSGNDIHEIGRKLDVQTVLEGSVRKSGDRLRITAQLINTGNGFHMWSRQFDRKLEDIFEIQEEIANSIASFGNMGSAI